MTTIATDGKTMSGDGLATCYGSIIDTQAEKVHRLKDGRIAGIAGDAATAVAIIGHWNAGEEPDKALFEEVDLLVIDGSDRAILYGHTHLGMSIPLPAAIGSGQDTAMGAMLTGASPKQAVEAACKRDIHSGGKIRTLARTK